MNLVLTGKDKAARVPLDYFRKIGLRKWVITAGVGVVTLLLFAGAVASGWWTRAASPGAVHSVHARWENDCAVCHQPFQPTGSQSALQGVLGVGKPADALCQTCHNGPPHHPASTVAGKNDTCSSCHAEHRGRQSNLRRSPDPSCTSCHSNLSAHVQDGKSSYANEISKFDRNHPQFNIGPPDNRKPLGEATDPGKLKFNHKLHLLAGQRSSEKEAGGWKLSNITDQKLRERYTSEQPAEQRNPDSLVQLTCASCHLLDATDGPMPASGSNVGRSPGDYYLPANYDQHCKACHPLTFSTSQPTAEIPHHLQPDAVHRFLMGALIDKDMKGPAPAAQKKSDRPLPGENISLADSRKRAEGEVNKLEAKQLYLEQVKRVEGSAFSGKATCGLCHSFDKKPGESIPSRVVPTNVPQVWFPHAKFSHSAHHAVDCIGCHKGVRESEKETNVLLPGVATCQECHASAKVFGSEPKGGIRSDCTTCHLYHEGDKPLSGLGALKRGVDVPRSIKDFLNGKPPQK